MTATGQAQARFRYWITSYRQGRTCCKHYFKSKNTGFGQKIGGKMSKFLIYSSSKRPYFGTSQQNVPHLQVLGVDLDEVDALPDGPLPPGPAGQLEVLVVDGAGQRGLDLDQLNHKY